MWRGGSIFRTFLVPFALTVLITGVIIAYIGYRNTTTVTEQLISSIINEITVRIEKKLETFTATPTSVGNNAANILGNIQNPDSNSTREHMLFEFASVLLSNESVSSIEYATEENETFGVVRDVFDLKYGYTISGKETHNVFKLYEFTDSYQFLNGKTVWEVEGYDVKTKDWYATGIRSDKQLWTSVYAWPNGDVGLDLLTPVYREGKVSGVIDISVTLSTITNYVKTLLSEHVEAVYILEEDGNIIAGTDISKPAIVLQDQSLQRVSAASSESDLLKVVYKDILDHGGLLKSTEGRLYDIEVSGKTKGYTVTQYTDEFGLVWYVIAVVNKDTILSTVERGNQATVTAVTALLLFAVLVSFLISKGITGPITNLASVVTHFSEQDGDIMHQEPQGKGEVLTLGTIIHRMMKKMNRQVSELQKKERQLAIENEKLDLILGTIGEIVILLDPEQRVLYRNKQAAAIEHPIHSKMLKPEFRRAFPFLGETGTISMAKDMNFIAKALESRVVQSSSEPLQLEDKKRKEARIYVATAAPILLKNNEIYGVVVVAKDITEERKMEIAKTDIVSLASHQLRTPLSMAKWYTELLTADQKGLTNQQKKHLAAINSSVERMITLVNTLLSASQVGLGISDISAERIQIREMINSLLEQFEGDTRTKNIGVKVVIERGLKEITSDKKVLYLVMQNLISNAIKYSNPEGKISIVVSRTPKSYIFTVEDQGIGIPDKDKDKVFDKLFRGSNAGKHDPNGNGLGLYIVRSLLQEIGGKIFFESKEGEGTRFTVTIPVQLPAA